MDSQNTKQGQNTKNKVFLKHPLVLANLGIFLFYIFIRLPFYSSSFYSASYRLIFVLLIIEIILLILYSIILLIKNKNLLAKKFFWIGVVLALALYFVYAINYNLNSIYFIFILFFALQGINHLWKTEEKDLTQTPQEVKDKIKLKRKKFYFILLIILSNIFLLTFLYFLISPFLNKSIMPYNILLTYVKLICVVLILNVIFLMAFSILIRKENKKRSTNYIILSILLLLFTFAFYGISSFVLMPICGLPNC